MPLTEGVTYLVTAAAFALGAARFDEVGYLAAYLALFTVLIALSVIDGETLRLPDRLVFPSVVASLVVIGIASLVDGSAEQLGGAAIGAFCYFGILLIAHLVYPAGMGFGDVKLAFLLGLYLGWPTGDGMQAFVAVVWAMLLGFGLGSVIGIGVLAVKGRSTPYPFGPFLVIGAGAVMLLLPELVAEPDKLLF
jgi:leader peptidase (prepilin peptidase)/N-methyltransferase